MDEAAAILLIEDEARLRHNLQILLEGEGYRVTTAQHGAEGIKKAKEESYDLVITDLVMPEMNGFEVMNYLRTHLPDTVVLAITGYVSTESAVEALRGGAYDYLSKPFDVDIMKVTVERALEKVRLQKALRRHMSELEQKVEERTRELKDTNQKLEQSLVELKAAQEHLIQAEKLSALGELIAAVAHELNTPLSTIALNAQLVTTVVAHDERATTQLERIGDAADHCRKVVKNLLSFARKQRPEVSPTDLNEVCDRALELVAYQLKVNSIDLEKHLDARLPRTLADPHQLQQVFINLATNACQAMAASAGRGRLVVETKTRDGAIEIGFHDDGPGISDEHQRKIFDPFFTTKAEGTGLGLSISYGIVKEHGGEITVRSSPGRGTSFVIELPVTKPSATATDAGPSDGATAGVPSDGRAVAPGARAGSATPRVLIVDDDTALLDTLAEIVQALGFEVRATALAAEALAIARTLDPDVVLTDLNMPGGIPGSVLLERLLGAHPKMRVIVLTGNVDPALERQIRALGASDFLRKPVDLKALERAVVREARIASGKG